MDPSAESGSESPGVTVTLSAFEVVQLSVALAPAETGVGLALKDVMTGEASSPMFVNCVVVQPVIAMQAIRITSAEATCFGQLPTMKLDLPLKIEKKRFMRTLFLARYSPRALVETKVCMTRGGQFI
jgi:hypothetical protein